MTNYGNNMKVIFSIPGRIRIKIPQLYRNEKLAQKLSFTFKEVKYINKFAVNIYSGNVVVVYNNSMLEKDIIEHLGSVVQKINTTNNKVSFDFSEYTNTRYSGSEYSNYCRNEFYRKTHNTSLIKKLLPSVLFSTIVFITKGYVFLGITLSVLIIYKGIKTFIQEYAFGLFLDKLISNNILLNKNKQSKETIKSLNEIEGIIFDSQIVIQRTWNNQNNASIFFEQDTNEIQRQIALGRLTNPVSREFYAVIADLRKLGLKNIAIINKSKIMPGIVKYAAKYMGAKYIQYKEINEYIKNAKLCLVTDSYDFAQKLYTEFEDDVNSFIIICFSESLVIGADVSEKNMYCDVFIESDNYKRLVFLFNNVFYYEQNIKKVNILLLTAQVFELFILSAYYVSLSKILLLNILLTLISIFGIRKLFTTNKKELSQVYGI